MPDRSISNASTRKCSKVRADAASCTSNLARSWSSQCVGGLPASRVAIDSSQVVSSIAAVGGPHQEGFELQFHGDVEHEPGVVLDLPTRSGKRPFLSERLQDQPLDLRQQVRIGPLQFDEGGAQLREVRVYLA